MDNFKIIYRVLKILEQALDCDEFDTHLISSETLKISKNRLCSLMIMLNDEGYIKGINITRSVGGFTSVGLKNIQITMKGLEYLSENSLMQKVANIAKGAIDAIS